MPALKKIWKYLSSMQFAVLLLVVLAAVCCIGSFITQGLTYAEYAEIYSEKTAAFLIAVGLDDVYHCWWFLLIAGFLCCNLLLCNLLRLPQLIRRTRKANDPEAATKLPATVSAEGIHDPEALFRRLNMPQPKRLQTENGLELLFSSKHRVGLWGAWVCHLGILLLIVGFALGQATHREYTVYGVPGQTKPIGDTGLLLTIDDFTVGLREDDTVSQYTAQITVRDLHAEEMRTEQAEISVNHPADLFGLRFYQNSTGWAATVSVTKDSELLQEDILCAGEYLEVEDKPGLIVVFSAFYPDYVQLSGQKPATASGQLNNPAYLYMLYYKNELIGMNVLTKDEVITADDYTISFSQPQSYTLIQIKKDSFTMIAFCGGLLVLLGLVLAFYIRHTRMWAIREPSGLWTVHGFSARGGALFSGQFEEAARETNDILPQKGETSE